MGGDGELLDRLLNSAVRPQVPDSAVYRVRLASYLRSRLSPRAYSDALILGGGSRAILDNLVLPLAGHSWLVGSALEVEAWDGSLCLTALLPEDWLKPARPKYDLLWSEAVFSDSKAAAEEAVSLLRPLLLPNADAAVIVHGDTVPRALLNGLGTAAQVHPLVERRYFVWCQGGSK